MQTVKKIAFAVLVLFLSSAIYLLLVDIKGVKKSVLRPTLEALGNRLYAAVAEDEEKAVLKNRYDDFIRRAEKQEIPPQQIEKVAAEILNLSKRDSIVSSGDAMRMLFLPPLAAGAIRGDRPDPPPPPMGSKASRVPADRSTGYAVAMDETDLAKRLQQMQIFHDEYKRMARKNRTYHAFGSQFAFSADSGLRILISKDLQKRIISGQYKEMDEEFAKLEKRRLLTWRTPDSLRHFSLSFGPDSTFTFKMGKWSEHPHPGQRDSITIHISGN